MSNLDPALEASQTRQHQADRATTTDYANPTTTSEAYRSDAVASISSYSSSSLPAAQPYYQYANSRQSSSHVASSGGNQNGPANSGPDFSSKDPSDTAQQNAGNDASGQDESKRQRACEACRGLKVRCDQDPQQPDVPCKRCAKAGRACVITQPSRKRQKKADSRVAELEKKLDALTAALKGRHSSGSLQQSLSINDRQSPEPQQMSARSEPARPTKQCDSITPTTNPKRKRMDEAIVEDDTTDHELQSAQLGQWGENVKTAFHESSADDLRAKINGLVPFAQSSELFRRYNDTMSPWLPMVVFPRDTKPEQIFQERPILYLAIITAASGSGLIADKQEFLQREVMGVIADCVVRNGEKSLELIQAMLILTGWYRPPERAEQTNFYQILHMAAVMALDIGLGRRSHAKKQRTPFGKQEVAFSLKSSYTNSDTLEARRAWLGCYYLCATASMVLRRPNLVRWTEYMKECIEVLETSPDAHPSDKLLCQHIKIQHICEDVGLQFLMDDSTAQININDPKVTYALVTLENKLKEWREKVPPGVQCASLTFFEHVTSLYLHEIALHFNHNIEDFRLPFTEESLKNVDSTPGALTQAQITAIEACQIAAHGILNTMTNFTLDETLALPLLLFFVRCVYALVILIKMHVAINTPGTELGKLMRGADLKIEFYMNIMIDKFNKVAVIHMPTDKPNKALRILVTFREWLQKYNESLVKLQNDSNTQPEQVQQRENLTQTPLHMLSQVATGQQKTPTRPDDHSDWTFQHPYMISHAKPSTGGPATSAFGISDQHSTSGYSGSTAVYAPNALSMVDASDFGWGSGFEQAMDMTLGHMSDLQGGALDNWLLGTNVAADNMNGQWQ